MPSESISVHLNFLEMHVHPSFRIRKHTHWPYWWPFRSHHLRLTRMQYRIASVPEVRVDAYKQGDPQCCSLPVVLLAMVGGGEDLEMRLLLCEKYASGKR